MQTAVEWLVDKFKQYQQEGEKMTWQQIIDTTELALAMEKEQIIEAYGVGTTEIEEPNFKNGTDYYNQTYKP
jgi:hypothetical protein